MWLPGAVLLTIENVRREREDMLVEWNVRVRGASACRCERLWSQMIGRGGGG